MRQRRTPLRAVMVAAALAAGCVLVGSAPMAAEPAPSSVVGSSFVPRPPLRVLDTRNGTGGISGPVGPGRTITLDLSARVPAGTTAVVLNVTGVAPTAGTYVTVYSPRHARPVASNLNLPAGDTRPNLVTVEVAADRTVNLFNFAGTIHLVADLAGHYAPGAGARFTALPPNRVLDTRANGGAPLAPGAVRTLDLTGLVPASATAVTLNLTGVTPTAPTYVTAWPTGTARPTASNLNLPTGSIRANQVTVSLGAGRKVDLYNYNGRTHLTADLGGFYTPAYGSTFLPLPPARVIDTRLEGGPLQPQESREVDLGPDVADYATAALVNVTGIAPQATYLGLSTPDGANLVSTLNLARGETAANLALVELRPGTGVAAYNNAGATHLIADLSGLFVTPSPDCAYDCAFTWGENFFWERGNGDRTLWSATPTAVTGLSGVTAVVRSGTTGYALRTDGTVWAWGSNVSGELGNGWAGQASPLPVPVVGLTGVTAIAAGTGFALALRSDGTVWSWGSNARGNLGNGSHTPSSVPVRVAGLVDTVAVAAGGETGFALSANGTVRAWGDNINGQLGTGSTADWSLVPVRLPALSGVTGLAAGVFNGYAVRSDGTVWSWGYNLKGELGNGSTTAISAVPVQVTGVTDATAVASGARTAYAVRPDGSLLAWGDNQYNLLGNDVDCEGPSEPGCQSAVPVPVHGLTGVTELAADLFTAYALRGDGTVWGWGSNSRGQLGTGQVCDPSVECAAGEPVRIAGLSGISALHAGIAVAP